MPAKKSQLTKEDKPVVYLLQTLDRIINDGDISTVDPMLAGATGAPLRSDRRHKRGAIKNTDLEFFEAITRLVENEITSHEQTKNDFYHMGSRTTDMKHPLVFLAARLGRKNIFEALLNAFGENIGPDLVEDEHGSNILHLIYRPDSEATVEMIDKIFTHLEQHYSRNDILKMINATDEFGQNVFIYATNRDISIDGMNIYRAHLQQKIALYADVAAVDYAAAADYDAAAGAAFAPPVASSYARQGLSFFARSVMDSHDFAGLSQEEQDALAVLANCFQNS